MSVTTASNFPFDAVAISAALAATAIALGILAAHYRHLYRSLAAKLQSGDSATSQHLDHSRLVPRAFEETPLGCIVWEPGFRVLDWNRRAEEIFGWQRDDILHRNFVPLLLPVYIRDRFIQDLSSLFADGALSQGALPHVTRGGTTITCEWHHSVMYDDKGGPSRVVSVCVDLPGFDNLTLEHSLFRSLIDLSDEPSVMILKYPEGSTLYASVSACQHFGESLSTLIRRRPGDWDARLSASHCLANELGTAKSVTFESEHRHAMGHSIPVEVTLNRIESCGQTFVGVYIRNISRRRLDEALRRDSEIQLALRKPEQRYREIFVHASDAIFTIKVQGADELHFDSLNPAATEAFGVDVDRLSGARLQDIVAGAFGPSHGRSLARNISRYSACVETAMPVEYEDELSLLPCENEAIRRFQVKVLPLADDHGIERLVCIGHDITLRSLYESELLDKARLEERMSHFFVNAPGHFFTLQCSGRHDWKLLFASPGIRAAYGLGATSTEALLEQMLSRLHPDDGQRTLRAIVKCYRRLKPCTLEFRILRPDSSALWVELRAAPHATGNGLTDIHAFMHDITVRKETEQRLGESRLQLQELAARREQVLEDERKRIAQDIHEELGQALTALRLRISALSLEYGNGVPGVQEKSLLMLRLVDRALQGMRSVVAALRPPVLDAGLAAGIEWLAQEFTRHTDIECALHPPQAWPIIDDKHATAVFRILQEALTNAARHANASRVDIIATCHNHACTIKVRDNGNGFAAKDESSASFGVASMRERALMLAGRCEVHSRPGHGTVVEITFPYQFEGHNASPQS